MRSTFTNINICIGVVYETLTVDSLTLCKIKILARNVVTISVTLAGIADCGIQYESMLKTINKIVGINAR